MCSLFNRRWESDSKAFGCTGAFQLSAISKFMWYLDVRRTAQVRLKVSRSPNSLATVSSPKLDLYCFSNRVHVSVYSVSVTASLIYAFSNPSRVTMIL